MFHFTNKLPIVCTAIHNGHNISDLVKQNLAVSEETRLREEDPFTDYFALDCENRIIVNKSRFEVDLNRPREKAIYEKKEDAWGIVTRRQPFDEHEKMMILEFYDRFYQSTFEYLSKLISIHKRIFVFDIHSYNHHRLGKDAEFDSAEKNPEIILGTNNMPSKFHPLIKKLQAKLRSYDYFGRELDVRINVKFSGGYFSRWIHNNFPDQAICVAIEFKKIFMDEWTGKRDITIQNKLRDALSTTFDLIIKEIGTK